MTRAAVARSTTPSLALEDPAERRVIVALHGGRAPMGAVRMGRLVSTILGAPLHGMLAWPSAIKPSEVPKLLELPPESLHGMVLNVEVGDAGERLAAIGRSHPHSLLVVGAEPVSPLIRASDPLGVGPIASRAITDSQAAVLVVRDEQRSPKLRRILLPLDGTVSTAGAIQPAGELAHQALAALDIVYVGAPETRKLMKEPGSMVAPQYVDQPQHEWPAFSDEFLQRFLGAIGHCPLEVPTRFLLGAGEPAREILRFADELGSDLVVLVWHGVLSETRGVVFREVIRNAHAPVLILKG